VHLLIQVGGVFLALATARDCDSSRECITSTAAYGLLVVNSIWSIVTAVNDARGASTRVSRSLDGRPARLAGGRAQNSN
jgi:hypothetical protein